MGLFALAAGAALSIGGALIKGKAAKKAAKAEQRAAETSARFDREQAAFSRESADIIRSMARQEAAQIDRQNRLRLGAIRAAGGASGGRLTGSIEDILADVAAQGELEKQNALFRGRLGVRQEEQTARGFDVSAQLALERGKSAKSAGKTASALALLGAAPSIIGLFPAGRGSNA